MYTIKYKSKKNGYTLIEVIIAAVIFSMLITVTMITFGSNSNLQSRSETIQASSSNAKYISEAIARDIRLADKIEFPSETCEVVDNIKRCTEIIIMSGNDVIAYKFNKTNSDDGSIEYKDQTLQDYYKLNLDNINVDNMYFIDELPSIGIFIHFVSTGLKVNENFEQTIDTSVTTKNYPNYYDKFTPEL